MVLLIFTFSLVSISSNSLSLFVVMLAVSLASIFIISSNMGLVELVLDSLHAICPWLSMCKLVSNSGGGLGVCEFEPQGESTLFFACDFSPVDLRLFFESFLCCEASLAPSMNWSICGWSSSFNGFAFLELRDTDMFPSQVRLKMFGKPANVIGTPVNPPGELTAL